MQALAGSEQGWGRAPWHGQKLPYPFDLPGPYRFLRYNYVYPRPPLSLTFRRPREEKFPGHDPQRPAYLRRG